MMSVCARCVALVAVLAVVAGGAVTGAGPVDAIRPPALAFQQTTLPNGLQVVIHEDRSTPVVSVQVWYHVGSKDERSGRSGFAHLFEHLMFQGSKNVKPDEHGSLLARAGGQSNAFTTEDVTVYWNTVPPSHLPLALWLEADRMASLRIEREPFERERQVVQEERRMRIENRPYGRLPEHIYDFAYLLHPYKRQPIGSMADLDAARVEDVRDFYRTYYVPNNAVLMVAGDVDAATVLDLVTTYFGRVPRRGRAIPRVAVVEPAVIAARRHTVYEKWPLPVLAVAHHVAADSHADTFPLKMASKILSDGESSRIYRSLVYGTGTALAAYGGGSFMEHPGLFFAVAIVQPGFTPDQAEALLTVELDRLRSVRVTDRELERARRQVARDFLIGRTTVDQKARALGRAALLHGSPGRADEEFERLQAVTADDIQRVANTYFAPASRLILRVLPDGPSGGRP